MRASRKERGSDEPRRKREGVDTESESRRIDRLPGAK